VLQIVREVLEQTYRNTHGDRVWRIAMERAGNVWIKSSVDDDGGGFRSGGPITWDGIGNNNYGWDRAASSRACEKPLNGEMTLTSKPDRRCGHSE